MSNIHSAIQALFPNLLPIWAHLLTVVVIALVVLLALYKITAPPKSAKLDGRSGRSPPGARWTP